MSNDLISKSALVEELKKFCGKQPYLVSENIWEIIKNQPTAYDVGKVVEQLEEIREEILTDTTYDNDTVNYYLEYADLMIEDVKAGGEDKKV